MHRITCKQFWLFAFMKDLHILLFQMDHILAYNFDTKSFHRTYKRLPIVFVGIRLGTIIVFMLETILRSCQSSDLGVLSLACKFKIDQPV